MPGYTHQKFEYQHVGSKQSPSSLTPFLRYCKDIGKLLFWVLWACLATTKMTIVLTRNDNSTTSNDKL